ncbi:efflux RND transporter periplasmic adaptor subunit [Frigoriglobus tundricola]|uniref:RND efflux system, membrane fusion protein n=1 Tax=Frigoriglobus tundricola TaxID=2774151 RepID=A0A6M5YVZ7_9BACT|nr:efflux RND transporter periplasmic adaptor subunit [Frigoriglobus tundricola]QJW98119.1 RND efflux system, membrane fusion protein [Frigoriglobus tundricola]
MSLRAAFAIGLVTAAAALAGCARKAPEPVPTKPPPVVVDHPVAQKVNDYEDFAGRTEAFKVVELKSRVTGYLKKIHFKDGQDVEEGKQLFDIDNRTYKAELDRANAALVKAEKHLITMRANYRRSKEQHDKGVIGTEEFDNVTGLKLEAEADIDTAQAAVELAATNLRFCHITAPFDGRLSKRLVDEENLIKADETSLTTIVKLDEVYATFDMDERTVIRVRRLIQKGEVTSSRVQPLMVQLALADDDDFSLSGLVTFVDSQIDPGTGTLRVRATVHNPRLNRPPGYLLSPGQFVRVRVPIGPARDAVLVPEKALGSDQGQRFLFVVNAENKVERRNVRVGQQYGTMRVIEGGAVTPTDRVIVDGLLRVRPAVEVNPTLVPPASKAPIKTDLAVFAVAPEPHAKQ